MKTKPVYRDDYLTVYCADCRDVLDDLRPNSIDAIITDPPYALNFMGKQWDHGSIVYHPNTWRRCLRVLKPGGHMLAFGGTRTWHRLACAIEDAGFELRDSIAWLYGSGFPKSLDVSKAIDKAAGAEREVVSRYSKSGDIKGGSLHSGAQSAGVGYVTEIDVTAPATDAARQWQGWGTALKPAFEPVVVARKPLIGTVAANVQAHGTGALNVDGCRVEGSGAKKWETPRGGIWATDSEATAKLVDNPAGRWPTNVVLDTDTAEQLDKQSGYSITSKPGPDVPYGSRERAADNRIYGKGLATAHPNVAPYGDSGGASRFFPTFKYQAKAPAAERPSVGGIAHPTVKPLDLMRWLIRLVTPPGGTVLDPFAGTGTTGEAALLEDMRAILIEQYEEYIPLILERINRYEKAQRRAAIARVAAKRKARK